MKRKERIQDGTTFLDLRNWPFGGSAYGDEENGYGEIELGVTYIFLKVRPTNGKSSGQLNSLEQSGQEIQIWVLLV